jgi:hypothetical protein
MKVSLNVYDERRMKKSGSGRSRLSKRKSGGCMQRGRMWRTMSGR